MGVILWPDFWVIRRIRGHRMMLAVQSLILWPTALPIGVLASGDGRWKAIEWEFEGWESYCGRFPG